MTRPSLSIVTAVRNGAATIADSLESLRAQTVRVEHIVIDGCSTDRTLEIVRQLSPAALTLSEPDQGIYDAMNKGIALATGEVVGLLNSDDRYAHEHVLEKVARVFENPEIEACYGDLVYVAAPKDRVFRYWKAGSLSPAGFYRGWMPPHPTFFVRRAVYGRLGGFDLSLGSAADYELMLRFLLKHGLCTTYIPEVLVRMRIGGASNAGLLSRIAANRMDRRAWTVNGMSPRPWTLLCKPLRKIPQYFASPPPVY